MSPSLRAGYRELRYGRARNRNGPLADPISRCAHAARRLIQGLPRALLIHWLSKAFGERMGRFPWIRRVMNDLAGRNLNAAADFLSKLSQFDADVHP
jgi:hypothetical protein